MVSPVVRQLFPRSDIPKKMAQEGEWMMCDPLKVLEEGLLSWCRRSGRTINLISGAYSITQPVPYVYSPGVMHLDWVLGNLQESPIIIDRYFQERETPWVWWSDKRHEPADIENRLRWLGLHQVDRVWGMTYDVSQLHAHSRPDKFHITIARDVKGMDTYSQLFRLTQGYTLDFQNSCVETLRQSSGVELIYHHTAFYRGKGVGIGTFHQFPDYGLIMHLGVHPKARRRGIATLLLEELVACAWASRTRHVMAFVTHESLPFFRAFGFEPKMAYDIYATQEVLNRLEKRPDPSSWQGTWPLFVPGQQESTPQEPSPES